MIDAAKHNVSNAPSVQDAKSVKDAQTSGAHAAESCVGEPALHAMGDGRYDDLVAAFCAYQGLVKRALVESAFGLTKSQIMMMATVNELGSVNMTTLSKRMAVSKEQATRAVQPLVEAGFLKRSHHATNRRMVNVSLTPAGVELLERHFAAVDERLEERLQALEPSEIARLLEASRTAARLLCRAQGDACFSCQQPEPDEA